MMDALSSKHVVMIGIGHTNAHVVRMWRMQAPADTDLTCISDFSVATYSGMLPALLAGQISRSRMEIDLVRLCSSVGARLITDPVAGLNHDAREVLFKSRPPIPYDVLSIGIGSKATVEGVTIEGTNVVPIKPMQTFLDRLRETVSATLLRRSGEIRVAIVGGGVAGAEITFCLPGFLKSLTDRPYSLHLVTSNDEMTPELAERTRKLIAQEMHQRGVHVITGQAVSRVTDEFIALEGGVSLEADVVIWATGAAPPKLLRHLDLKLDARGFVATDHSLQSLSAAGVFAVGDTGTIVDEKLPKAGVYAVRQGPVLWENIHRHLDGRALQRYQPQRSFLKLLNLGDGRAIGQWKSLAFSGRWVKALKDRIDGRFMDLYQVKPMDGDEESEMQCRGCGCKLASDTLDSALQSSEAIELQDAAFVGDDPDAPLVASTDFFSSPVDDSFLAGRIAALHSASDIIATGARVTQALANVVVPQGDRASQRRLLHDFLSGAQLEFDLMGAAVVGGHTIVGPRMEIGFTVIGCPLGQDRIEKKNLRPGDQLYLTKPLGIGVLLAAHMRAQCPARSYTALLEAMLVRQHALAEIAVGAGIVAGTDVTGFGLAGHLLEMACESRVAAHLELDAIPMLPGAIELVSDGVESSLLPDNLVRERDVAGGDCRNRPEYRLLFDPQTCGGILYGVAEDHQERFVDAVVARDLAEPSRIGYVTELTDKKPLTIV